MGIIHVNLPQNYMFLLIKRDYLVAECLRSSIHKNGIFTKTFEDFLKDLIYNKNLCKFIKILNEKVFIKN